MRERAAGWTHPALDSCTSGQDGFGAGAAAGGGGQRGDEQGEGEDLRGKEGGVVVSAISCMSHSDWQITGTCLPQLLVRPPSSSLL